MPLSFDEVADGPTNMALDAALLEQAEADGQVWGRVYGWSSPWITLGRFQSSERDLRLGCPVPWVIRPTGGRAVLHGHDLTIGLAGPLVLGRPDAARGSLRETYRVYVRLIIEALRLQGIPVALGEDARYSLRGAAVPPALRQPRDAITGLRLVQVDTNRLEADQISSHSIQPKSGEHGQYPRGAAVPPALRQPRDAITGLQLVQVDRKLLEADQISSQPNLSNADERGRDGRATGGGRSADCFAHVAANDVVDERTGMKVCGCALRMTDRAVLLQASIPVGPPLIDPARAFAEPSPSSFVALDHDAFCQEFERLVLSADCRTVKR